ncbi:sodium/calcium exchanger 2-like isoform X1 [Macrosteles quadrilineatus]|uniref:sodium/calcium exchanger 2-like isoform X1 n=1 Tax=Macrosteles quadrilineatus TaxID=74068 RepID=UPI0023E2DC90|nr:sodium/calcium exchanger 2-like isoform X1 [Macrosteles quadrilineatus]
MSHHDNISHYKWGPPDICSPGLILPIFDEREWNVQVRAVIYLLVLFYFFLGVAIVTDVFMSSIEVITSTTRKVYLAKTKNKKRQVVATAPSSENGKPGNGSYASVGGVVAGLREDEPEVIEVRVWNDTVANLTLMALGTSAPEILLSVIEIVGHNFESGKLGPGTIVGSAAFNLLIITSVCMMALNVGDTRRIERFKVFIVTGLFSFFAYIWLLVILRFISPDVVELWEACVTFAMFPILVMFAYAADRGWCGLKAFRPRNKQQLELGPLQGEQSQKMILERNFFKEGKLDKANLVEFVREVKKFPGVSDEDAAVLAAAKLVNSQPHSAVWYRIGAVRQMSGSRRIEPHLNSRLKDVYTALNEHKETTAEAPPPPDTDKNAIVEFHAATVAVKEKIGKFAVTIWRHGNLEPQVRVRVKTIDGTARKGEDYVPINEIITFEPHQREKQVIVEIVNDNKWEPNEEFFLRLSLVYGDNRNVALGHLSIMEITILDDDNPGIIAFEKRGMLVKESAGLVRIPVIRYKGSDGDVAIKWRTIDKSALSGRDYVGGNGTLNFKDMETRMEIEIPIINDFDPEKDEHFEVELFDASNGARIGNINRMAVTIANDDDFNTMMDRLMVLTNTNVDALRIHTKTWAEQIRTAMTVNGGDIENATCGDYTLHFFSFFWKVLFSLLPPPQIFKGWLCFICSLIGIGVMTAFIGDIAAIFGCLVGLDDTITAITLVALGTSLPDTFASRSAVLNSKFADDCIGNINGSNSVNVFLGMGLPWFMAAIYHFSQDSVFRVPAGALGFSVLMYSIAAVIAVTLLVLRRNLAVFGKAEIGGPASMRYLSVFILVTLWVLYIVLSWLQTYDVFSFSF